LAKAMLKSALAIRPDLILPIVSEAVHYLPSVQQPALLSVNPEDAVIVKQYMGEALLKAGWRIAEDKHIERGGCRVETASNQIDATTSTRWQRISSALDKNNDWLET
jgi:flagellar assembly protein FliH